MSLIAAFLLSLIGSLVLTGAFRSVALRTNLLDIPVSRSAHNAPVPVGGGIVIVAIFFAALVYLYISKILSFNHFMAFAGGSVIAFVGFLDDVKELNITVRIISQLLCSLWAIGWLGGFPKLDFLLFELSSPFLLSGLGVLALIWLVNLYNFMDGIDGIAASELAYVNVMSLFFVIKIADSSLILLMLVSLGCAFGFLIWNWSPAKIFMGDVGSSFIGFMLGVMAVITLQTGLMTVWTWIILLAVFVVDTLVTLVRRFLDKQQWYQGHATHAYQKAAKRFNSHQKVTITVMLINFLWLAPIAWLSIDYPKWGIVLAAAAVVPLWALALLLNAGKEDKTIKID